MIIVLLLKLLIWMPPWPMEGKHKNLNSVLLLLSKLEGQKKWLKFMNGIGTGGTFDSLSLYLFCFLKVKWDQMSKFIIYSLLSPVYI